MFSYQQTMGNRTNTTLSPLDKVISKECWKINLRKEMACHHVEDVRFQLERALYRKRLCEEWSYAQKQLSAMEEANETYMKEDEESSRLKEELVSKVSDLDKKLKDEEDSERPQKKTSPDLEDDLACPVCADLFVEPVLLPCGHLFCKQCVQFCSTMKRSRCPLCQARLRSLKTDFTRVFIMDAVVEKYLSTKLTTTAEVVADRRTSPYQPVVKIPEARHGLLTYLYVSIICTATGFGIGCSVLTLSYKLEEVCKLFNVPEV